MKKCTKCKVKKPLTEFSKNKQQTDGLSCWCRECVSLKGKQWYAQNKEKHLKYAREYNKTWVQENREHIKEYGYEYRKNNKEKIRETEKIYREENKHVGRWRDILKSTLKRFHRNKTANTKTLLGYSATQLKEHLDKQGMDWNNDHIDHIIPLSWFKKDTPIHIVNDLRNLQPLSAKENLKKSNTFGEVDDLSYIHEVRKWLKKKYKVTFNTKEK
jgi:hypothetical protein